MSWKAFIKPDIKKLAVFVILILVGIFLKVDTSSCFNYCPPGDLCPHVCSLTPLFFMPVVAFFFSSDISGLVLNNIALFSAALLVFWYFASCCLVSFYRQDVKKKDGKKKK